MLAICVEVCKSLTIPITVLQSSIRGSLVLSMLQQMLLDERIEEIRSSIVRCLAILVCFIEDNDKFQQVRYRLELVGFFWHSIGQATYSCIVGLHFVTA